MHMQPRKKRASVLLAAAIGFILVTQIAAVTAWTADSANQGPSIVILQMSSDRDTRWATNDLLDRLSEFITDDPYFPDRVIQVTTSNPRDALQYPGDIVVYMSHGGPLGMVTGKRLSSWKTMAGIVTESDALLHLFAACASRNIIRYGDEESGKKLYTVPGARPAEVTNVEIASTIMLALGINSEQVEEYRENELTKAKELVQSGASVHIMDFEQVILNEIEYIDDHYSDSYTDTHRVYRFSEEYTLSGIDGFNDLPLDLRDTIMHYFRVYVDDYGVPYTRLLDSCSITYVMNYYYEAEWVVDDPEPPPPDDGTEPKPEPDPGDTTLYSATYFEATSTSSGHWEYGPNIFNGGTYSGLVIFEGDGCVWDLVVVNVTASGPSKDSNDVTIVDSISLNQNEPRGLYVQKQKVDGVWQEPVVGRNPSRTGGLWTDSCVKADYEYDSSWPTYPSSIYYEDPGTISSSGEYITVTGIPTGVEWHGPSFVRTLPSYFKVSDLGSLSANLSLYQHGNDERMTKTMVSLYDKNKKLVAAVMVSDSHAYNTRTYFTALYRREDGTTESLSSDPNYNDIVHGVPQIRYDPLVGVFADIPGKSEELLFVHSQLNNDRLVKYLVIQSYRRKSWMETDERIYNIRLSYAGSEYTVFHDNCNDVDDFHQDNYFGIELTMENSEDGDTELWGVYDNSPSGAIYNVEGNGGRAIQLVGGGTSTGYRYPYSSSDYWNERTRHTIQWSMKFSELYVIYVSVDTTDGHRYLMYEPTNEDRLDIDNPGYIKHGLGSASDDGRWHTYQRNLIADLHAAQPTVDIIDVNAILFRGSGYIDDIKLLSSHTIKENAEDCDTDLWGVYDNSPSGVVRNVLVEGRRVIFLDSSQTGTGTGYRFPYSSSNYWNEAEHLRIKWTHKISGDFKVYVSVDTDAGHRYLEYLPVDSDALGTSTYVKHGLGSNAGDGTWRTFERDLLDDLHDAQPSVDIININAILFRGSGYIDDIMLLPRKDAGEFVVPSGNSYMSPQNIDARPTLYAWQGAIYVHALDRPFRLYQLSEFSVVGELLQGSSKMGLTNVALYDENMNMVATIYWGDSWGSSEKGYFYVRYYPESGGSGYQFSGYLYSSFMKTGKLWWDQWQGGQGAIFASIDGQGSSSPIAECDNAERVIKYVGILGRRYRDSGLVDMRIHDINVEVDLNVGNPNSPDATIPLDGSFRGAADSNTPAKNEHRLEDANSELLIYWTGPWPWLNFERPISLSSDDSAFHVKKDLLDNTEVVYGQQANWGQAEDESFWEEIYEELTIFTIFGTLLGSAILVFRSMEASGGISSGLCHLGIALWSIAITYLYFAVAYWLQNGKNSGWAAAIYMIMGLGMLFTAWGTELLAILVTAFCATMLPALTFGAWKMLSSLVIGSTIVRMILTITAIILLIFAGLTYTGILHDI